MSAQETHRLSSYDPQAQARDSIEQSNRRPKGANMDHHDKQITTRAMTPEQMRARAAARDRKAESNRRAKRIRRRVTGGATALFAAAFLGISVQMASGHDPALLAAAERREKTSPSLTASASSTGSNESAAAKKRAAAGKKAAERRAAAKRAAAERAAETEQESATTVTGEESSGEESSGTSSESSSVESETSTPSSVSTSQS
jgi:colicin import membrane protein